MKKEKEKMYDEVYSQKPVIVFNESDAEACMSEMWY